MTTVVLAGGLLLAGCGGDADGGTEVQPRQDLRRDRPADDAGATTAPGADTATGPGEVAGPGVAGADSAILTGSPDDPGGAGDPDPADTPDDEQGEETVDPASPWSGTNAPASAFLMPSGNVACAMASDWVACQILEHSYTPSEVADGCRATAADTILLRSGSVPQWICSEHDLFATARDLGAKELDYGSSFWGGSFNCYSDTEGVQCGDSHWGFRLARGSYELF